MAGKHQIHNGHERRLTRRSGLALAAELSVVR